MMSSLNDKDIATYRLPSMLAFLTLCLLMLGGHVRAQDATPEATRLPSLAEQVGFDDPRLDELAIQDLTVLGDSVEFTAFGHLYRLLSVWDADTNLYPTDIVEPPYGWGVALLYQTDLTSPKLVWSDSPHTHYWGYLPFLSDKYVSGVPLPGDWNHDGTIDFAVQRWTVFEHWASNFYTIYQLLPDNRVVSSLAGVIPPGSIVSSIDQRPDGTVALQADDISGEGTFHMSENSGPQMTRYFEWRGGRLVDTSITEHADAYYRLIGSHVYNLTTWPFPDDPNSHGAMEGEFVSTTLFELLKAYEMLGQKDAGWALAQNLVVQMKRDGRLPEGTYVDTDFMPTMKQLFDAGRPFVPPDYASPNYKPTDYYAEAIDT